MSTTFTSGLKQQDDDGLRMTAPQAPIGSSFGAASTAKDGIQGVDLSGKTALVMGGPSGIGLDSARALD